MGASPGVYYFRVRPIWKNGNGSWQEIEGSPSAGGGTSVQVINPTPEGVSPPGGGNQTLALVSDALPTVPIQGALITSTGTQNIVLPPGEDGDLLEADSSVPGGLAWVPSDSVGPAFADEIVPDGVIDGSNTVFTVPEAPNPPESLLLVRSGLPMYQGIGKDYTLVGNTITYAVPLEVSPAEWHVSWFRY